MTEFYLLRVDGEARIRPYRTFWEAHAAGVRYLQHGHTVELRRFHHGRSEWHPFDGHPPKPVTLVEAIRAAINGFLRMATVLGRDISDALAPDAPGGAR